MHAPKRIRVLAPLIIGASFLSAAGIALQGGAQSPVEQIFTPPPGYWEPSGLADPVTKLANRISDGKDSLDYVKRQGFLKSLLKHLDIDPSSQSLVFSKTSLQADKTSPKTPRAIYFNDSVYIGWAQGADTIDIESVDPKRGTIFYTLTQGETAPAKFTRREICLSCHVTMSTGGVPGPFVRSIFTNSRGGPLAKSMRFVSGHISKLSTRWGGWYVTGTSAGDAHLGNAISEGHLQLNQSGEGTNVTSLSRFFDASPYLSPGSDIVALLVMEHQMRAQNLMAGVHFLSDSNDRETELDPRLKGPHREALRDSIDSLLGYLMFTNEAPLHGKVEGTSSFAENFRKRGPFDHKGRSLRDFDLQRRLFKYPFSYTVYTPQFDALPKPVKDQLWQRLDDVLSGKETGRPFGKITEEDRQAVREILLDTKPEFRAFLQRRRSAG